MTDEEFENMSDEDFAEYEAAHQDDEVEMETNEAEEEEIQETAEIEPEDDIITEVTDDLEDTDPAEEPESEGEPEEDTPETPDETEETDEENTLDSEDTFDYKTAFTSLMAPLKANGQEIQVKSEEDARRLIQMGLNYDDKMVAIKPVRLAGKALERAGIIKDGVIDEVALNRMIDFNNGDIEVMKERLKELEIDPLDLDLEDTNYQAQDHMVSEHSIALDDVQRELNVRGSTEQVVNVLNVMDEGSKNYFSENPQDLLGLEQDITSGVFNEIYGNVQYERRMGRLTGKTDMEAYIEFAQQRGEAQRSQEQVQAEPKPTKTVDTKKRAKAAGTKPAPGKSTEAVNPFDMSDEEFDKMFGSQQAIR